MEGIDMAHITAGQSYLGFLCLNHSKVNEHDKKLPRVNHFKTAQKKSPGSYCYHGDVLRRVRQGEMTENHPLAV